VLLLLLASSSSLLLPLAVLLWLLAVFQEAVLATAPFGLDRMLYGKPLGRSTPAAAAVAAWAAETSSLPALSSGAAAEL
jgi:hypothetical protein